MRSTPRKCKPLHCGQSFRLVFFTALLLGFLEPAQAQDKYLGAATCASSNCHGSVSPRKASSVLLNEYTTWYKHGAHAQAWRVLRNKDSKIIAKHLGIGAAEKAPLCLKCHTTYVPDKNLRGTKFRISDGVGCESCHGAAERYLKPHTDRNSTHSANVKLGMIDLVSYRVRAKVCLECHHGTDDQTVNHRLIAAGHPRLTYELDTYGILQPNHWEVDDDYAKRKAAYNPARAWLVGQIERALAMVEALLSPKRSKSGTFPELSLFTCYTCHHSLSEDQWKSRSFAGRPGELQINISALVMATEGISVVDPSLGKSLKGMLKDLPQAYTNGSAGSLLKEIRELLGKALAAVDGTSFKKSLAAKLFKRITQYSATTPFLPYENAEQCAMAMSALAAAVDPNGKRYQSKIDAVYEALKNEEQFDPRGFTKASKTLLNSL